MLLVELAVVLFVEIAQKLADAVVVDLDAGVLQALAAARLDFIEEAGHGCYSVQGLDCSGSIGRTPAKAIRSTTCASQLCSLRTSTREHGI